MRRLNGSRQWRGRLLALAVVVSWLGAALPAGAEDVPGKSQEQLEAAVEKLVDDQAPSVSTCVHKHLDTGRPKAAVTASLIVNNRGNPVGNKVTVSDLPANLRKQVETCVKALFQGLKFPAGKKPVIDASRTWRCKLG